MATRITYFCEACRFYKPLMPKGLTGHCQRNPPVMAPGAERGALEIDDWVFPLVTCGDWCGAFQATTRFEVASQGYSDCPLCHGEGRIQHLIAGGSHQIKCISCGYQWTAFKGHPQT